MTVAYDDLVTAATLGITRRPLAIAGLGEPAAGHEGVLDSDPAAALLDAAALLTVARRAGVQPRREVEVPAPPADAAPALSARAVEVLQTFRQPWRYGGSYKDDDSDLMAGLLNAAAEAGYVAPRGPLLPELLDAAVRAKSPAFTAAVARVLGTRSRWLAQYNPLWRDCVAAADATDPETWHNGSPADRLAYLGELRDRDPAAARELLAASWGQEHGRERARLVAVLSRGLSPADEEFLESALKDRAPTVHAQVTRMLARLQGSAFHRRGSERAAGLLRLDGDDPNRHLTVTLPGKPDAAAARDGVTARPPSPEIRSEAWWLVGVLAAAPLSDWTARFGLSPREIIALPVEGGLRAEVLAGWRLAAASQLDPEWGRALLDAADPKGADKRPPEVWPPDHVLAAALPPGEWATVLLADARLFNRHPDSGYYRDFSDQGDDLVAEVAAYPSPWPADLADTVIAAFEREIRRLSDNTTPSRVYTRQPLGALLHAAGRCMPVAGSRDYAADLTRLAAISPSGRSAFESAAKIITLRRAFYEEIS